MVISKTLEVAITSKNVTSIHSIFYTIAHEDPNFSTGKFRKTLEYVKSKNIPGVMENYNGKAFALETEWTQDYWADVASELVDNFCDERINHLEQVGKKVFPKKQVTNSENGTNKASKKKQDSQQENETEQRIPNPSVCIGIAIVVVIVLLLILTL